MSYEIEPANDIHPEAVPFWNKFNRRERPTLIPTDGEKDSLVEWGKWQKDPQTNPQDLPWQEAKGIAILNGINGFRSIDIDDCKDREFLEHLLSDLDLTPSYHWSVETPNGFHIWYLDTDYGSATKGFKEYDFDDGTCDHIEHRVSNCYTLLPPSMHPSGDLYQWRTEKPEHPPATKEVEQVEEVLESISKPTLTTRQTEPQFKGGSASAEKIDSALEFLSEKIGTPSYSKWLRICSSVVSELGESEAVPLLKEHFPPIDGDKRDYERKRGRWATDQITIGTLFHKAQEHGWSYQERRKERPSKPSDPLLRRASDIEEKKIQWLWDGYLAEGTVHLVNGIQGVGKTTMLLDIGAQLTNGSTPTGENITPQNIVYINFEDVGENTLVPRFRLSGGNSDRCLLVGKPESSEISLPSSLPRIRKWIEDFDVGFCVIDPLFAFMEREYNRNSGQDARKVLGQITKVASETGCAILLVRHPSKKSDSQAIFRAAGSNEISAHARLEFTIGMHPDYDERRVMAWTKNNLSHRSQQESLVCDFHRVGDEQHMEVKWKGTDHVLDAELYGQDRGRKATKRREARQWLEELLSDGPVESRKIMRKGEQQDFSESTLRRAKKELPIESERRGKGWEWGFEDDFSEEPKTAVS